VRLHWQVDNVGEAGAVKVIGHMLHRDDGKAVTFRRSPNESAGIEHLYIAIHFTAGRGFDQSCDWLCNPKAQASAHLVIGRDGEIAQLVPFSRRAWHAGVSRWQALTGMNSYSIGIELDNPGPLQKRATGWYTWFGVKVPDDLVVLAPHKYGGPERGWHAYSDAQFDALYEACEALIDAYPDIADVLGHEDIAPGRKSDPGPAFNMESLRSRLFGREGK
jgi:N-acetylmuramoyl-L-alanine amidase